MRKIILIIVLIFGFSSCSEDKVFDPVIIGYECTTHIYYYSDGWHPYDSIDFSSYTDQTSGSEMIVTGWSYSGNEKTPTSGKKIYCFPVYSESK